MSDVMIVDAVRSPVGRRNGGLSGVHPAPLLGAVQKELVERTGIEPGKVGQVVGGCVGQVGEQAYDMSRTAWLTAGLPISVAATTVEAQCGSSQQATSLAAALVAAGVVDTAIGCGVESMSRVPIGSAIKDEELGHPFPPEYRERFEWTSQFEGAERIAKKWEITREDTDAFGLRSQQLAKAAWDESVFDSQIVAIDGVDRDEGLRETTSEGLAGLKPVLPDGVHTAGNSSQISDGASAVLVASRESVDGLGLKPKARIIDHCLVGTDPELMLTGPIDATRHLLERNKMSISDIDIFEINEAFASVVLAWYRELGADLDRVNPSGGAIALGHPLGGTGGILISKAVGQLEHFDKEIALVSMCCGGGLGTGMLIERV